MKNPTHISILIPVVFRSNPDTILTVKVPFGFTPNRKVINKITKLKKKKKGKENAFLQSGETNRQTIKNNIQRTRN